MTFPSTPVLDNFNRADGGLGTNWSVGEAQFANGTNDGLSISGNRVIHGAYGGGAAGGDEATWNVSTYGPDVEVYFTVAPTVDLFNPPIWVIAWGWQNRANTNDAYFLKAWDADGTGTTLNLYVYKYQAGVFVSLLFAPTAHTITAGDQIGISMIGGVIDIYLNGLSVGNFTDGSPIASPGYLAFEISDGGGTNSCGLDDFGGGTLASGFTGTLDKTLGGLTLLASGYLERLGALNQTFPTLSVQATGTLSAYHVPTLINVRDITATGAGAIGVDVVNNAISQNVRANSLQVENGGSLEAHGVYYDTITTIGTGAIVPIRSDRAVWDVTNYADRHASDIYGSTWAYHRNPALSGAYTVDHPSVRRILDVTSVSLNEMAALLGTLLDDLGLT